MNRSKRRKRQRQKRKRQLNAMRMLGVGLVVIAMAIGSFMGLLWFARPTTSELENRTLSSFPALSLTGILNGHWFSEVSTWYSDTFPGRESLMSAGLSFQNLYGLKQTNAVLTTGTADELPPLSTQKEESSSEQSTSGTQKTYSRTEVPDLYIPTEDVQERIMQGTMVKDGGVYSGCYFVQESADAWFDLINRTAQALDGTTTVYSVLVPNNSGVMLTEEEYQQLGGTNQKQEIEYYYSNYSDKIRAVETIDTLREHNNEYLYFRTDHHWTPLGAYYVYRSFCETKGITPAELESFESYTFEPFSGSYASQFPTLDLIADSVTGYVPKGTNDMVYFPADPTTEKVTPSLEGEAIAAKVFNTTEGLYGEQGQYMRFIAGDQGFAVIDNPEIEDGTSCLIVKESFGNCFVPFLVDHYDKVYIADFRYNTGPLVQFCKDNQVTDLILFNNIQLLGSTNVVATYENILQPA